VSARSLIAYSTSGRNALPISIPLALWIVRQTAEALQALHDAGWLHGDIKPDNLLVTPQGRTTLIDFGFARRLDGDECQCGETMTGSCVYAPPEMIVAHDHLTPASDLYSLGITLFELLTGRLPMPTTDRATVVAWHLRNVTHEVRDYLPHAPLRLSRLLRAMLARQPLRRPGLAELIPWLMELEVDTLAMR
jgi:serine/threonine protein kinase